jgi:hypothetical protein
MRREVYRVLVWKPVETRPLGRLRPDRWIILGWISRRWDVGIRTGLGWPRIDMWRKKFEKRCSRAHGVMRRLPEFHIVRSQARNAV